MACREASISQQSYYRWRKEYGGLELDQARRMKDLERENARLKRLVADLSLDKQVLKEDLPHSEWSIDYFSLDADLIFFPRSKILFYLSYLTMI